MLHASSAPDPVDRRSLSLGARIREHRRTRSRGQSLVEFGLILPVFLLLFATTLDLGRLAFARVTVTNAAREGAFQAAKTPTDFSAGAPCPSDASSNKILCRIQLEARSSGVTIAPTDVSVSCTSAGCANGIGNRVTVSVVGHFTLLTPLMSAFFGGSQNISFTASATNQIETLPPPASAGVPIPTPTPSSSATPTPTPTAALCNLPSAGFTTTPSDLSNVHAPFTIRVTDASTSPNCAIQSWLWSWGDASTSLGQVPPSGGHTYVAKGTYTITLKVTNSTGSNTTGGLVVTVRP